MSATHTETRQPARRSGRTRRRGAGLAILCVGVLLATSACGARWDDAQREQVLSQTDGQQLAAAAPGDMTTGQALGTAGRPTEGQGTTAAPTPTNAAGAEDTGQRAATTPASGAAPAQPKAQAQSQALPCTAPSDAPGVTDTSITIGTISTLSGAVPGLGASSEAAARAYVAYRNATGGVCGRQLVLKTADDGMDNGRHRQIVTEMNDKVIGIMGGLGGGDAGSADTVTQLDIPVVNVPISKPFDDSPVTFNINPYFADIHQPLPKFEYYHSQGVRKAAIAYTAVDQTRSEVNLRQKPEMIAAGIEVVDQIEIPLSTLSYDSYARRVANSGADYLFFLADGSISASMARAMYDTGYKGLKFAEYLQAYGSNFADLAGPGADGAVSPIRTLPNEEPGASPEQDAFLEWFHRVAPDQPADTFAADSWVASKAFVDNLEALPGPITRKALLDQIASVGEYDAGGFLGPIQLGPQISNGCVVLMRYESGAWRRVAPDKGFMC